MFVPLSPGPLHLSVRWLKLPEGHQTAGRQVLLLSTSNLPLPTHTFVCACVCMFITSYHGMVCCGKHLSTSTLASSWNQAYKLAVQQDIIYKIGGGVCVC